LIGLLQLANAHPYGSVVALGYTHKKAWIIANLDQFFRPPGGQLSSFAPASFQVIQRHVSAAQALTKVYYACDYSNDQSGADQEDMPEHNNDRLLQV